MGANEKVRGRVRDSGPWGFAEAIRLGVGENFEAAKANQAGWVIGIPGRPRSGRHDAARLPALSFYHPALQGVLLDAAADAGAEVRRRTSVNFAATGSPATVEFDTDGKRESVQARLVVGSESGRSSGVRQWCRFQCSQG